MSNPQTQSSMFVAAIMWGCIAASVTIAEDSWPTSPPDGKGEGWHAVTQNDFVEVNCGKDCWSWDGDLIKTTGKPTGVIRLDKVYTNFELLIEWRHLQNGGNSGIFVWANTKSVDNLRSRQLPHGIEVQVLDTGYTEVFKKQYPSRTADWFTCHGDVFPTGSSSMRPFPPSGPPAQRMRSFPTKQLTKDHGEWNHYYVRAVDGEVRLYVNGEQVSGGTDCKPSTGYVCLESEGAPIEFRNFRIHELPSNSPGS